MNTDSKVSQELHQRIAQIQAMAEMLQARTAYVDRQQRYQFVSKQYEELYRLPTGEILGKTLKELTDSTDYQNVQAYVESALAGNKVSFNSVEATQDGAKHQVRVNYTPDVDDTGAVRGIFVIYQDATERKSLEDQLNWMTFQRDSLTKVVPGKFSYLDAQLRYQYVSQEYQDWYQKPSEEIVGKTVEELMGAEGARNLREHLETALTGQDVHYEFTKLFNDGEERTMIIDYIPHFNSTREFLGFFVSCQDVTEQKVLKKALECATFQMQSLTGILPGKFSYLDTQLRYQFVSKQYEEWYEKPREEILGRTVEELMGTEGYQKLRGYMEAVLSGKEVHYEFTKLFNDGEERTMSIDYIPYLSSTGEVLGYLSSCQDITELKRLREALRESEVRLQLKAVSPVA